MASPFYNLKMPSKALYMLWIVLITLPNPLLAGKEEDKADVIRFKALYIQDSFIRESNIGKEFVHPDDPNKVVIIKSYNSISETINVLSNQVSLQKLMEQEEEIGSPIPITQRLYRVLKFKYLDPTKGTSMEMDRYRGNLLDGILQDGVLRESLLDFPNRLKLYKNLAFIFQQMSALDMKFCNIKMNRILYKKAGDDFSTSPLVETDSDFNFVLTDFSFVTKLNERCLEGIRATWDHDDAQGDMPKSDKCKGKIEIFGLGMLILKIESLLTQIKQSGFDITSEQKVQEALKTMPEGTADMFTFYRVKTPILFNGPFNVVDMIWRWVENANKQGKNLQPGAILSSGKDLLKNLAYVERANALIFEQRDMTRYPALVENDAVRGKVMGNYAALNKLLQSMLQPNDYVNGRPTAANVVTALTNIQQGYVANIQSLARDRILLV